MTPKAFFTCVNKECKQVGIPMKATSLYLESPMYHKHPRACVVCGREVKTLFSNLSKPEENLSDHPFSNPPEESTFDRPRLVYVRDSSNGCAVYCVKKYGMYNLETKWGTSIQIRLTRGVKVKIEYLLLGELPREWRLIYESYHYLNVVGALRTYLIQAGLGELQETWLE